MDEELRQAWAEMKEGLIAYNPTSSMRQGHAEEVIVRIMREPLANPAEGFREAPAVERLRTSGSMSARLEGDPDEFRITPISSAQQALVGPHTDWIWTVMPLKAGDRSLYLHVAARIYLSNGENGAKDVLVKSAKIRVEVDSVWFAANLAKEHWQYILASPILLGLISWIYSKWPRKNKSRSAGF